MHVTWKFYMKSFEESLLEFLYKLKQVSHRNVSNKLFFNLKRVPSISLGLSGISSISPMKSKDLKYFASFLKNSRASWPFRTVLQEIHHLLLQGLSQYFSPWNPQANLLVFLRISSKVSIDFYSSLSCISSADRLQFCETIS